MIDLDDDDDEDGNDDDEGGEDPEPLDEQHEMVKEVLKSKFDNVKKIPNDMRRLVSDLVAEEWGRWNDPAGVTLTRRVCDRFESWKAVDPNTIDMMVEEDFSRDLQGWSWKYNKEQVAELASAMELAVFRLLVEELLEDACEGGAAKSRSDQDPAYLGLKAMMMVQRSSSSSCM
ncbi:hypothetical protein SAY87_030016 [Trapa incisa]|uniref:DUF4378 domain-containing protein n=2 Tax=Trapa TaxID=22665 RepID=A0AAN7KU77_TRANT|nr:hypothetical protein SAY87_030016 [Trapa incisa]KAK4769177.1 hypothetical protein SAY86_027327 [Trapa natans]